MLSLPDFKEKQILFIQTERGVDNKLKFSNDNIVFLKDGKIINRASCHRIFTVFIIGDISITTGLMRDGLKYGISFFFLKNNFEVYTSISAKSEGNYILKMKQYNLSDTDSLEISKKLIENKINNQLRLLKSIDKNVSEEKINSIKAKVRKCKNSQELMGIEGNISREFFGVYFNSLDWLRRSPRTKTDIPNFLLDIGYTLLFNFMDSLLRIYGFDTYKGFYHKLFFQRKSLPCDVIEPFRCIIDKQLRKSWNLGQIDSSDFKVIAGKYTIDFHKQQKYTNIFSQLIMDYKKEIYLYTQEYYRHIMNPEQNSYPVFNIKIK